MLEALLDRKRRLALDAGSGSKYLLRPPQGAIQAAVLEVLRAAPGSLRVAEIHRRVEEELGRAVSRDTVTSLLSVACRTGAPLVLRVARGTYAVAVRPWYEQPPA
ncbi:MAG: hypothetical protein LC749_00410 [Actinobacteria bacterium]|nr:hypothetical protein [Actinomycetota bacterium]